MVVDGGIRAVYVLEDDLKEVATDVIQFVEYDQRAHRLNTLVTFSFWVQSML